MAVKKIAYPVPLKQEAAGKQHGLVTVSIVLPDGTRYEEQGTADVLRLMFMKWAMAIVFCPEVRELPDLETKIKELMQ